MPPPLLHLPTCTDVYGWRYRYVSGSSKPALPGSFNYTPEDTVVVTSCPALTVMSRAVHIDDMEAGSMPVFGAQGGVDAAEPVMPDLFFPQVGTAGPPSPRLRDW